MHTFHKRTLGRSEMRYRCRCLVDALFQPAMCHVLRATGSGRSGFGDRLRFVERSPIARRGTEPPGAARIMGNRRETLARKAEIILKRARPTYPRGVSVHAGVGPIKRIVCVAAIAPFPAAPDARLSPHQGIRRVSPVAAFGARH